MSSLKRLRLLFIISFVLAILAKGDGSKTEAPSPYALSEESAKDPQTAAFGVLVQYRDRYGVVPVAGPVAFQGDWVTVAAEPVEIVRTRKHPDGLTMRPQATIRVFPSEDDARRGRNILAEMTANEPLPEGIQAQVAMK